MTARPAVGDVALERATRAVTHNIARRADRLAGTAHARLERAARVPARAAVARVARRGDARASAQRQGAEAGRRGDAGPEVAVRPRGTHVVAAPAAPVEAEEDASPSARHSPSRTAIEHAGVPARHGEGEITRDGLAPRRGATVVVGARGAARTAVLGIARRVAAHAAAEQPPRRALAPPRDAHAPCVARGPARAAVIDVRSEIDATARADRRLRWARAAPVDAALICRARSPAGAAVRRVIAEVDAAPVTGREALGVEASAAQTTLARGARAAARAAVRGRVETLLAAVGEVSVAVAQARLAVRDAAARAARWRRAGADGAHDAAGAAVRRVRRRVDVLLAAVGAVSVTVAEARLTDGGAATCGARGRLMRTDRTHDTAGAAVRSVRRRVGATIAAAS